MIWNIDNIVFGCVLWVLAFSEMIKFRLFMEKVFAFPMRGFWKVTVIFSVCIAVFSRTSMVISAYKIIIMILAPVILMFVSMGSKIKKIIFFSMTFFLVTFIDEILSRMIDIAFSKYVILEQEQYAYLLSNLIVLMVLTLVCFYKFSSSYIRKRNSNTIICIFLVFIGISMPMAIVTLEEIVEYVQDEQLINTVRQLIFILFIGLIMLVLIILYVYDTNMKMEHYLEYERMLKETQKNYYESLLQKEEKTRRYRHDMANHLVCLSELAKRGENTKLIEYVNQMQNHYEEIQNSCYSVGNQIMDIIVNHWVQELEDINVIVRGACGDELAMDSIVLCIIFSNLLQNAVEELKSIESEDKYLKVYAKQRKDHVKIEIWNSSGKKEFQKKTGLPQTTKRDKENHGMGLRNVKETIERNKGYFECKWSEGSFKVSVILPLKKAL